MKLKRVCALALAATMVFATGCSNNTNNTSKDNGQGTTATVIPQTEEKSETESYPITIEHAFGQTVIEKKPEKVATIAFGNQDVVLALGVNPAGVSAANFGQVDENGLLPWTAAKYEELGITDPVVFDDTDGLDYEAISDSNPEVILAAYSGLTEEEYATLSQIAPVVAYPEYAWQTYWREQTITNATGMGMKEEGEALVAEMEALIHKTVSNYTELEGKSAAFFYFNPTDLGTFYIYLPTDPRASYLQDLGLSFPESVLALAEDKSAFTIQLSAENLDVLDDIDIIITYGDDATLDVLQADALVGKIPAVANGSVVVVENNSNIAASATPTVLSIPATIEEYVGIIAEAARKVK